VGFCDSMDVELHPALWPCLVQCWAVALLTKIDVFPGLPAYMPLPPRQDFAAALVVVAVHPRLLHCYVAGVEARSMTRGLGGR
jgi:hypothetical protein